MKVKTIGLSAAVTGRKSAFDLLILGLYFLVQQRETLLRSDMCRKCAIPFEPLCANSAFFDTFAERFRAGLGYGKFLIFKVAAAEMRHRT